jgi:predicted RNA-binding Zn-ribbon protein involved in translation (DUF1610 family)
MKLKDVKRLGLLRDKTIDDIDVDLGGMVVHEEFLRPDSIFYAGADYRARAINRLITMKEDFAVDNNVGYTFRKKYFSVKCPYCESTMYTERSSGCGSSESDTYSCGKCGSRMTVEYPGTHSVYVSPPDPNRVIDVEEVTDAAS